MKFGTGGNLGLSREYHKKLFGPLFYTWWNFPLSYQTLFFLQIRVAKEGINATVGGSTAATEVYIQAVLSHPLFSNMTHEDFKVSKTYMFHFETFVILWRVDSVM